MNKLKVKPPDSYTALWTLMILVFLAALWGVYSEFGPVGLIILAFVILAIFFRVGTSKQSGRILGLVMAIIVFSIVVALSMGYFEYRTENCQNYLESTPLSYGDKITVSRPSIIIFDAQFAYLQKGQTYWSGKGGNLNSWPNGCEFFVFDAFATLEERGLTQKDDPFFLIKGKLLISRPATTPTPTD